MEEKSSPNPCETARSSRCQPPAEALGGKAKGRGKQIPQGLGDGSVARSAPHREPVFAIGDQCGGGTHTEPPSDPRVGPRSQSDFETGRILVIGMFKPRTCFMAAHDEYLAILGLLGFSLDSVQEVLSGGWTMKAMRVRLSSWSLVGDVVQASRERPIPSTLCDGTVWMGRTRSPAEAARTAPLACGVRALQQVRDSRRRRRGGLGRRGLVSPR